MKKLLSLTLILALVLGLLAGCGAAASPSVPESDAASAEEASVAPVTEVEEPVQAEEPKEEPEEEPLEEFAPEEEPSEEVVPEAEYEKVSYELPLFEEAPTFSAFYPLRNTNNASLPSHDSEDYPFWARVQENLNVDLTFKEPAQDVCAEQYNLMLASGDYTDLIFEGMINSTGSAYAAGYDSAIEDDIYVDLMDYIEYAPNYAYYILGNADNKKAVVTDNGAIGAFMKVLSEPEKTNIGLCVRTEYMDATGMEIPDTVDGWMEVFEAMSKNGVKYPINVNNAGQMLSGYIENAMGACISTKFLVDAESGDMVFGPTTDETKAYIELFIECADKGWMDPDWFSFTGMENPLFTDGSIATCQQIAPRLPTIAQQLGFEITPCPVLHREGYGAGQLAIRSLTNPLASSGGGIAVTTACNDVESVCIMLDWMYSDEGADIINYGWIEGETYTVENGIKLINEFYSANNEDYGRSCTPGF